jgi:hypothetical protein
MVVRDFRPLHSGVFFRSVNTGRGIGCAPSLVGVMERADRIGVLVQGCVAAACAAACPFASRPIKPV